MPFFFSSPLFSSFSSILFLTLPFLLCLVHWPISAVVSGEAFYLLFPRCSHMFLTCREPGVPLSLIRSYPLPFPCRFVCIMFLSLPFLLCICSLIYICGSFRGGILSAVSHVFVTRRGTWSALSFSFVSIMFLSLPFLLCLYSLIYTCYSFRRHSIYFFPLYSDIFCRRMRNALFLLLFPFLSLFFYIVPYPSFSLCFFIDLYLL